MAELTVLEHYINVAEQPDEAGEFLRGVFFNQSTGKYGCYSTFELNPGVEELPDETVTLSENTSPNDWYNDSWTWTRAQFNDIIMRYYWDGDGMLEFLLPDGSILSNDDCKKDYGWTYKGGALDGGAGAR